MNFLSISFLVFFIVVFVIYHIVKVQNRYLILFFASYVFYGFTNPMMLFALIGVTLISYVGGLFLQKQNDKEIYVFFFVLELLFLAFFKYTSFLIENINAISESLLSRKCIYVNWEIVLPVGLSFMIFQACTYLSDVYRNRMDAEKNLIKYATFVAFFPTVLSGPIQKAHVLIPQISMPNEFNYEEAKKGTLLFVWGAFEKVMIANKLCPIYMTLYADFRNRSSSELLIAAISFSLYIYADFSSYSDMARGISKILGIDVGKNFNNPYLSITTSEFWNRWHMSLNEWFIDNVYIPLGGNRKGTIRKYINVMIVFFLSGLWHGASWNYVFWGLLNGLFVIIGQILRPYKTKIYLYGNVDEKLEGVVFLRRIIVFLLITLTWVFFTNGIFDSLRICKKIVLFDFLSLFNPNLLNIAGTVTTTFVLIVATILFCKIQIKRQNEQKIYDIYSRQPLALQCLVVAVLICVCVFAACATDTNVDTRFMYFQF